MASLSPFSDVTTVRRALDRSGPHFADWRDDELAACERVLTAREREYAHRPYSPLRIWAFWTSAIVFSLGVWGALILGAGVWIAGWLD